MRNSRLKFSVLLLALPLLTACPIKDRPRVEHENRKDWTPQETPVDPHVKTSDFSAYDLTAAYAALKDGKGDLINRVLKPLSKFVLNGNFIERPEYRTIRMKQMIEVFNSALLDRITAKEDSGEFLEIKNHYYRTVFAGCSRDLKSDCYNASLFTQDTRHTRIMTLMAVELDKPIEALIKTHKSSTQLCVAENQKCRDLVEDRYRLLAMALYKRNRYDDPDFSFAYLKHARIFGELVEYLKSRPSDELGNMSTSYLAESHGKIFETIIPKFQPRDKNDPEFKQFVENFNPWSFSAKKSDIFQYGTRIMFKFAANCCMYTDATKSKLSPVMEQTIRSMQNNTDMGITIYQMVKEIETQHQQNVFRNLKMLDVAAMAGNLNRENSPFYNEFFFVVDRLYRGDLTTEEVEMVLKNVNQQRLVKELPRMISDYVKIQMAYQIYQTNKFMRDEIYTSDVASDEVFKRAVLRSRDLTSKWGLMQERTNLLQSLMGNYFKTHFLYSDEYRKTDQLVKSLNRNIHYLSVYPQMMVLSYFLAKMDGKIVFDTWWGRVDVDAGRIIGEFLDGNTVSPWFRFGNDPETLNRQMLLFSFEYLLSTESLRFFVAKDGKTNGSERAKFFDQIFGKYFDPELVQFQNNISDYERNIFSDEISASVNQVCKYELGEAGARPPDIRLDFLRLSKFTYSGLGKAGVRQSLMNLLTETSKSTDMLRGRIESRALVIRTLLEILEADIRQGTPGLSDEQLQNHPDTLRIRDGLKRMEELKSRLAQLYLFNHKRYFRCALILDEVERRRANRLYEEERAHLGKIYDLMAPIMANPNEAQRQAALSQLTQKLRKEGYRYDEFSGSAYQMSQYDLFMRIKGNLERDIFVNPTDREKAVYGATLSQFNRSRPVQVNVPENVERNDITGAGRAHPVIFRGTREDFIRQGMSMFSGKSGAYIGWFSGLRADPSLDTLIAPMVEFYLIGPIKIGEKNYGISKEELAKAYLQLLARMGMDKFDEQNAIEFGEEGLFPKKKFESLMWEKDFRTRLPLFYDLSRKVSGSAELLFDPGYKLSQTLEYSRIFNTLQPFVFEPKQQTKVDAKGQPVIDETTKQPVQEYRIAGAVRRIYGDRMHDLMNRVSAFMTYVADLEKNAANGAISIELRDDPKSEPVNPAERFALPFFMEGTQGVKWYSPRNKNISDEQKREDVRNIFEDFVSKSGNFFYTQEKVKNP